MELGVFPKFQSTPSYHIAGDLSPEISPLNTHFLTLWLYALGTESKFPPANSVSVSPTGTNSSRRPNDEWIQKMRMMLGVLKTSQMYRHHGFPRIGCVWKCCVPLNPMVFMIIIPFLNGYFIGNIPYYYPNCIPNINHYYWFSWSLSLLFSGSNPISGENSCSITTDWDDLQHGMPPSCSAGALHLQGLRAWATTKLKKYKEKNWSWPTAFWARSLTITKNHYMKPTWWLIPLSKWVITPVISGLTLLIPCKSLGYNPLTKWDEPPSMKPMVKSKLWLAKNPQFLSVLPSVSPVSPGDAWRCRMECLSPVNRPPIASVQAGIRRF